MKIPAELRRDAKAFRAAGYKIVQSKRNTHTKWYAPGGIVVVPSTAGDWRTVRNTRAELRRKGWAL